MKVRRAAYRIVGVLLSFGLAAGCAARSPVLTPSQLTDLSRADALVREGCYRCLQEALGIYTGMTDAAARRPPERALRGAFDVTLLLAVREKEVGIAADATLAQARALLARLPPAAAVPAGTQPHADPRTLLEAAEAIEGDVSGHDSEERQQREARRDASPRQVLQLGAATDLTTAYLALALDCEQRRVRPTLQPIAPPPNDGPALLRYRFAICGGQPASLTPLREADSRWTEIYFFEGKHEMGTPARSAEPERAAAFLTSASEALPASIAVWVMLANAHEMNGDFAAALAGFDRVLAAKPAHVDARLGRVRNLSYLGRTDEGIAAATTLIEAGTWHVGDAYYWRAWNAYQARRLEPAWADVGQALSLLSNTAVYALAGSIAYARKDLGTAVRHFNRAFEIDPSNCLAVWSAGLVHTDQAAWQPAGERFTKAAGCFTAAAKTAQSELAALEQSSAAPERKARRIASVRKRIESAGKLAAESTVNAAKSFATGSRR